MSTTVQQDEKFAAEIKSIVEVNVDSAALESAISWIAKNLSPYEVFDRKDLIDWASGEDVETIFSSTILESWAENNGY